MFDKIIDLYYEGYSEGEIAAKLGIPLYEVKDALDDWYDINYPGYYDDEW